jgi:septal ring factor EnvC (AmiA/AmiB activator)
MPAQPTMEAAERLKTAGRNDDCPCGSGKKYKKCHLRADEEATSKQLAEAQVKADASAAKVAEAAEAEAQAQPGGMRPKAAQSSGPSHAPKTPMSHKPMSAPRKAGVA